MHLYKYLFGAAIIGICYVNIVMGDFDTRRIEQYANKITANLPTTWRIIEEKTEAIPYGHYDGFKYDGPKGLSLLLEGEQDVLLHWKDKNGDLHKEALAKETLELWVMPSDYHKTWKRFFRMKRSIPAELLYSDKMVKVYGYPGHHIITDEKFKKILLHAVRTSWPDSPTNTGVLSWKNWKEDIQKILGKTMDRPIKR